MASERDILRFLQQARDDPALRDVVTYSRGGFDGVAGLYARLLDPGASGEEPILPCAQREAEAVALRGWATKLGPNYRLTEAGALALAQLEGSGDDGA